MLKINIHEFLEKLCPDGREVWILMIRTPLPDCIEIYKNYSKHMKQCDVCKKQIEINVEEF